MKVDMIHGHVLNVVMYRIWSLNHVRTNCYTVLGRWQRLMTGESIVTGVVLIKE